MHLTAVFWWLVSYASGKSQSSIVLFAIENVWPLGVDDGVFPAAVVAFSWSWECDKVDELRMKGGAGLCSAPVWKVRVRKWIKEKVCYEDKKMFQRRVKWKESTPSIKDEEKYRKNMGIKRKERKLTLATLNWYGSIASPSRGRKGSVRYWRRSCCKWSCRGSVWVGTAASAWGYSGGGDAPLQKTHPRPAFVLPLRMEGYYSSTARSL